MNYVYFFPIVSPRMYYVYFCSYLIFYLHIMCILFLSDFLSTDDMYCFFLSEFLSTGYVYFFIYDLPYGLCVFCFISDFLSNDYAYLFFLSDVLSTDCVYLPTIRSPCIDYVYYFSYLILYLFIMCIYFS